MEKREYIVIDKKNTYIEEGVTIGKNVIIYPGNYITGKTIIEDNVTLLPNNYIDNSIIKKGSKIHSSVIETSEVGERCIVGPYAHLRPHSILKNSVKVGNFCEIKNSTIGDNTKVSHLAYIGDAIIGRSSNIGCGVIFVNYNGKIKANTYVGDNCFIGSNVNIIAPLSIANNSYICAGTTLTKSTLENDFVIARPKEIIKADYAAKYMEKQ